MGPGLLPKASLEPDEHVSVHPALRDTNLTGDEIRPLMLVGDQLYRVFAPDWHRLGKRLLTMTTTGQNPAPSTLPERRLITNGAGRQDVILSRFGELQWLFEIIDLHPRLKGNEHHLGWSASPHPALPQTGIDRLHHVFKSVSHLWHNVLGLPAFRQCDSMGDAVG